MWRKYALATAISLGLSPLGYALDKSAVQPTVLSLPSGPGSIEGLGDAFTPMLNTGTSGQSLAIALPPGRNGFMPSLVVDYSSGYGNGILGLGRKLSVPFIQRQSDQGLPNYTDYPNGDKRDNDGDGSVDEFDEFDTYVNENGEELVALGDGKYQVEFEQGFALYEKVAKGWLVKLADGTSLVLGQTARIEKGTQIYQWLIESATDVHGNRIDYVWRTLDDTAQAYLSEIRYNHTGKGGMSVAFGYENRPDVITDFKAGFEIKTLKRLTSLEVKVEEKKVRGYAFSYEEISDWQPLSLLSTVTQSGRDGGHLPPASYSYTRFNPNDVLTTNIPSAEGIPLSRSNAEVFDMNADGLPDIIDTSRSPHAYWLNQGPDASGKVSWSGLNRMSVESTARISSPYVQWADINGDGRSDMVTASSRYTQFFTLNNTLDWEYQQRVDAVGLRLDSESVRLVDINNDKRTDVLRVVTNSRGKVTSHSATLNLETGWSQPHDLTVPEGAVGVRFNDAGTFLADMNGDGLPDLVKVTSGNVSYFPHRGLNGFGERISYQGIPDNWYSLANIRVADMNGDGLSDLVYLNGYRAQIWPNLGINAQGQSWLGEELEVRSPLRRSPREVKLLDINGNGSTDILWHTPGEYEDSYTYADLFPVEQPNQLKTVRNGIGRETRLFYTSVVEEMVRDETAGHPWSNKVPIAMQVLKRMEVSDGYSNITQVTEFDYHEGYYHSEEKTFRGFAASEQTQRGDQSAPDLITAYTFDLGKEHEVLKGKPLSISAQNAKGQRFWQETHIWQARQLKQGVEGEERDVHFAALVAKTRNITELGQGTPVSIGWNYDYDNYGNLITLEELGRLDAGWDDERITRWRYSGELNPENNLVRLPLEQTISDENNKLIAKQAYFYDDETFSGVQGALSKGNLTLKKAWFDPNKPDAFVLAERHQYDEYGNRIASFDPLYGKAPGHEIRLTFDETFHTFPKTESLNTGKLWLTASASFDPAFGGMIEYTDYNQAKTHFEYDEFGRTSKIVKPGDSFEAPTTSYSYHLAQASGPGVINWVESLQREQINGGSIQKRSFYDGLGRLLMTRGESERAGEAVVTEHKEFNKRGLVKKHYLPFFAMGMAVSQASASDTYTEQSFDALGRVVAAYQPEVQGQRVYQQTRYLPLQKEVKDEEQTKVGSQHVGAFKRFTFDGLLDELGTGRLRLTEEVVGLDSHGDNAAITAWATRYDYNLLDNFTRLTDAQGNQREMRYDGLGRELFVNDPDRGQSWKQYDDVGNLLAVRDARGMLRQHSYDGANRLHTTHYSQMARPAKDLFLSAPEISTPAVVKYFYDTGDSWQANLTGRLAKVEDQAGSSWFDYDERGRVVQSRRQITGLDYVSPVFSSRMTYDSADRPTSYSFADGSQFEYKYNARGLLSEIPGVAVFNKYTAHGAQAVRTFSNGIVSDWQYDGRLRLSGLNSTNGQGQELQALEYQYDSVSNLLSISDRRSQISLNQLASELNLPQSETGKLVQQASYQYDDLYRLTSAKSGLISHNFKYDLIGNLRVKTESNPLTSTQTLFRYGSSADAQNSGAYGRIGRTGDEVAGPHALSFNGETLSYDANGNRLGNAQQSYTWDHDNRLIRVQNAQSFTHYGYDFEHQRRIKQVFNDDGSGETVVYIDANSELRNGKLHKHISLKGQRLASSSQSEGQFKPELFYLTQHLGSTAYTLDAEGEVLNAFSYKPYGELAYEFGQSQLSPYLFTGKEKDQESGLDYFEHRYLSGVESQFITPDPVFADATRFIDPQLWSPYSYARNNPTRYTDPDGQIPLDTIWDAASIVYDLGKIGYGYVTDDADLMAEGTMDLAADSAALLIPYVPAGSSKVARLGGEAVETATDLRKVKNSPCPLSCFVAGTQVLTQEGYAAIEDIRLGDLVWAKNIETGEYEWKPVTHTWVVQDKDIYRVIVRDSQGVERSIDATDSHPFFVVGRGWVNTVDLLAGDLLEDKAQGQLDLVSVEPLGIKQTAYNFSVADFHTYFVTRLNVLVHNCGGKLVSAKTVKFSQNGFTDTFTDGKSVKETAAMLKYMPEKASTIPAITTVQLSQLPENIQKKLLSQGANQFDVFALTGNRRLGAAKMAGSQIKVRPATSAEISATNLERRFSTDNAGRGMPSKN